MPLAPGTWLAHYEILGHLGSGGMGDVYHARDNKLQREVALKVLPEHFAHDPERIARFRREAQLLAQLNHPNIAILYNFEETGETRFLVMELVLGETLRERIKRGPLPLEEALDICSQITEALEHAHEKPIIHRDLKPANVKVTPQGQVKVLDFGLAKAFGGDRAAIDPHDAPTGSLAGTLKGTILGTPAYMSLEQARGKETDKRTDIWALGCVLYELLTGKQAFTGDTVTEIIASVLKSEPDWSALPADTGPNVRVLLRRCLRKDLPGRFRDATDVRIQIEEARSTAPPPMAAVPVSLRNYVTRRQALLWSGVCSLVIASIAGLAIWRLRAPALPTVSRLAVTLAPNESLYGLDRLAIAISPDGERLVYAASRAGVRQLYVRSIDSLEAKPMPGTEGALNPFFSPDGQWVGFFAERKLKKVSINGGAPLTLANSTPSPRGAAWGPNDTIIADDSSAGLLEYPASGGTPRTLTTLDSKKGENRHSWPEFLPGGKAILFTIGANAANVGSAAIVVQRLDTGERRVLIQQGMNPHYITTGHIVYAQGADLLAVPFDLARLQVTGPPVPVVQGVMTNNNDGAQVAISRTGTLVYVPGASAAVAQNQLIWVDRGGIARPALEALRSYAEPRLSPDGKRVAVRINAASFADTWVLDLARSTLTRLTFGEAGESETPAWTPDGQRVTFAGARGPQRVVSWKPADGSGPEERLLTASNQSDHYHVGAWSPDGKTLAFTNYFAIGEGDIWALSPGQKTPQPFLKTSASERAPHFSPDGHWSPTPPMNPAATKCTCRPIRDPEASIRFRSTAAASRSGPRTARS